MKKTERHRNADLRSEYDFASMKGGVRGKYVKRFREQTNVVLLERYVPEAFPNEQAVNQALRGVLQTTRAVRSRGDLREESLRPQARRAAKKPQ